MSNLTVSLYRHIASSMRIETRHSVVLIAGTGITALLSMIYNIYVGRLIGPTEYADFAAALSIVYLSSVAWGPINAIVAKFTAEYASREEYGKILTLSREIQRRVALYGVVGMAIGLVLLRPLSSALRFLSVAPLLISFGIIYLTILLSVFRGILRGSQNFSQYNTNMILDAVIRLGGGVALLKWAQEAAFGLAAYLVALTATLFLSRVQVAKIGRGHEPQSLDGAAVKRFTAPMFLLVFCGAGLQNLDILFVKHFFAATEAGSYGAAATLARSIAILIMPFATYLLPLLTSMHEQGRSITGTLVRSCSYFVALAAGLLIFFWLWPEKILTSLYGIQFAGAASILVPLTAALMIGSLNNLIALAFASMNSFRFVYIYLAGLFAMALALSIFHGSLLMIVVVVFVVHAGMTLPVIIFLRSA